MKVKEVLNRQMRYSNYHAKAGNCLSLATLLGLSLSAVLAAADYEDGVKAAFSGDFDTAFREFSLAANQGLDLAQYNLAILYFTGQGVDQNYSLAFSWTEAAALQGHVNAQANLASLYLDGTGVVQDVNQAIGWFSTAGRSGHADAAMTLALMYRDGKPIERDVVQAHAWAQVAQREEHPEANGVLSDLDAQLNEEQLRAARRLFAQWQIEPVKRPWPPEP